MKHKIEKFYAKHNSKVPKGEDLLVHFVCDCLINSFFYSLQIFLLPILVMVLLGFNGWANFSFLVFVTYIHIIGYQFQRPFYL